MNRFSRLKHFIPDKNDPQENHATECLAACLSWSPRIRASFLTFFFGESAKLSFGQQCEAEVLTQEPIEGGFVDLLMRSAGKFTVVVEVKVRSPEDCPHHKQQLKKYREWLDSSAPKGYLFTLVRNRDLQFDPKLFGADACHTWWELHKHFKAVVTNGTFSEVEENLVNNLCQYLESEGIVSNYETKDLLCYAGGLKAELAITGIFNQIDTRLRPQGFESLAEKRKPEDWPWLRIGRREWDEIFGKGTNRKLSLWFQVPGIWECNQHEFAFDFDIWRVGEGNDWSFTKKRLASFFEILKAHDCEWTVAQTWSREIDNAPASEIDYEPKRIFGYLRQRPPILNQNPPQSEDDLVALLVKSAKKYAAIVSALKA